jgi:HK97 family phage portal protein
MGVLAAIYGEETDLQTPAQWLIDVAGGRQTEAGPRVNAKTANSLSAYYAAMRAISEDVGKLPLFVYERIDPRGKRRAREHPVFPLLHDAPNDDMGSMTFRETATSRALGWGGGFAEIERTGRDVPVALHLIHPSRVGIGRDEGKLVYDVRSEDFGGEPVRIPAHDMLHIHGLGEDGVSGYALSVLGKQAIGLGLATEQFGARFFRNGARPGGGLKHPSTLGDDAARHLRESWTKIHQGAANANNVAIMEEGMEWQSFGIPPEEAQFLETRQFQVEEIARWFRMPPHKLQHLLRSTFSNITEQNQEYVGDTLMPWTVRWEQEIKRKLFGPRETDYFAEHLFKGLLRGNPTQRIIFYRGMANIGAMSPNDIREAENENGIGPAGDVYRVALNTQPVDQTASGRLEIGGGRQQVRITTLQPLDSSLVRAAHLPLFEEAAQRVIAKEAKAAVRAAKKYAADADAFTAWADGFWAEQLDYLVQALTPAATSCALLVSDDLDLTGKVGDVVQAYAASHVERAAAGLAQAMLAGSVPAWADIRQQQHPARVAGTLTDAILKAADSPAPAGQSGEDNAE